MTSVIGPETVWVVLPPLDVALLPPLIVTVWVIEYATLAVFPPQVICAT